MVTDLAPVTKKLAFRDDIGVGELSFAFNEGNTRLAFQDFDRQFSLMEHPKELIEIKGWTTDLRKMPIAVFEEMGAVISTRGYLDWGDILEGVIDNSLVELVLDKRSGKFHGRVARHEDAQVWVATFIEKLLEAIPETINADPRRLFFNFWGQSDSGPINRRRLLRVPTWDEIRGNYATSVQESFDYLTSFTPDNQAGKIILIHGVPGSGKTYSLRALAHAWQSWCDVQYIIDPEKLLEDPTYIMSLILDETDSDDEYQPGQPYVKAESRESSSRWRLLILEDCDEVISADARTRSGPSLSRLLNLADGILGQGVGVLILLSTNEPVDKLHPAMVRPGRCLRQVEFPVLGAHQANEWLQERGHGPIDKSATLAELYTILEGREREIVQRPEFGFALPGVSR